MANMSYCRFENTYKDMLDCYQALRYRDVSDLSERELEYANQMMYLCESMIQFHDQIKETKELNEYIDKEEE